MCLRISGLICFITVSSSFAQPAAKDEKFNPLRKVVTLLQEMKAQVEKEAEEDKLAYNKYACWCTTNEKEKTEAIAEAERRLEELANFVEQAAATEEELKTKIQTLTDEIAADTDALSEATSIRNKDKAAFEAEEADMSETVAALTQALEVLSKVQLLQKHGDATAKRAAAGEAKAAADALLQVRDIVVRHSPRFRDVMQRDLFDVLGSFATVDNEDASMEQSTRAAAVLEQEKQDPSGLTGAAAGAKSYNSRSGGIFGLLSEMKDEFDRDLANSQKEEALAAAAFSKLKAAKEGEIAAGEKQRAASETALAELLAKSANAKEEIASLGDAKAADETFLENLQVSCAKEAADYEARVNVRSEEIRALGEALKILTEDDARDLFSKTMSFLQVRSSEASRVAGEDRLQQKAMQRILDIAKKHGNWALASIAVRVQLSPFTKVKAMMDTMLEKLKMQQQEEYEKKGFCDNEIDKTEDNIKVEEQNKDDLAEKHQALTNTIAVLSESIEALSADVAANEVGLKQAGEARAAENAVFKTSISDQRATTNILNKAVARLKQFYAGAELIEIHDHRQSAEPGAAVPPPPPTPKGYEKSAGAGGVLQMFDMIITDAEKTEAAMGVSEQHAQTAYATLVRDTAASINADRAAISEKKAILAGAEGDKAETEGTQLSNEQTLEQLGGLLHARHVECDWLVKYYDVRQTARQEEMDAISDAKAILSGSVFAKSDENEE